MADRVSRCWYEGFNAAGIHDSLRQAVLDEDKQKSKAFFNHFIDVVKKSRCVKIDSKLIEKYQKQFNNDIDKNDTTSAKLIVDRLPYLLVEGPFDIEAFLGRSLPPYPRPIERPHIRFVPAKQSRQKVKKK